MYFDDISNGEISEATLALIDQLIASAPYLRTRPNRSANLLLRPLPEDINFIVEDRLNHIVCPVLLLYGELDILVDPVKSLSLVPDKPNFKKKNYADTDHSMNFKNGDINPLFLKDKLDWIQEVLNAN